MLNIFLTGANGLLGSSFKNVIKNNKTYNLDTMSHLEIFKTDDCNLKEKLDSIDWIIHCAAMTNVEICEVDPDSCYRANCDLTQRLIACSNKTSRFLFISSTGVYGNYKKEPYHEYDKVEPTTVHHKSKLLAEDMILSNPKNIVVRTGWLYGDISKNDFVSKIINQVEASRNTIHSNSQQFGCPTYSYDLVKACIDLLEAEANGIFNIVAQGRASRFDYVEFIINTLKHQIEVIPVNSNYFKRKASVSDNETAVSKRANDFGINLPNWKISLASFLKQAIQ